MSLGKKKILSQGASGIVATDNFTPITYTGNSTSRSISTGFAPDFVWIKARTSDPVEGTASNSLFDSVRLGDGGYALYSNRNYAQETSTYQGAVTTYNSNGFNLGAGTNSSFPYFDVNRNGIDYVAWCWKAGGAAVSNTDGTITSQVSANTDAGFSIATYAGNSTQNATIGHGLTSPKLTIVKNIDQPDAWFVGSTLLGTNEFLELNESYAKTTNSDLNYQILSTTFKTTSSSPHDMINQSGENYVMYTFADVAGYQKVGSYSGGLSGSSNVIYTTSDGTPSGTGGFKPRFVIIKRHNTSGYDWLTFDSIRGGGDTFVNALRPNTSEAESLFAPREINFVSNGFYWTGTEAAVNGSGGEYIYLAIA